MVECRTLVVTALRVGDQDKRHTSSLKQYFLYTQLSSQAAQRHDAKQLLCLGWYWAKAVFQSATESSHISIQQQGVQLAIKEHSLAAPRYIISWQEQFHVAIYLTLFNKLFS